MPSVSDQDGYFSGKHDSSTPKYLLQQGDVARLLNGRFVEGAISNSIGFEELEFSYFEGPNKRIFTSRITYDELLRRGDIQLLAPLENIAGRFLVAVISQILFLLDVDTLLAYDITPVDAFFPETSLTRQLSFLDNDGGTYGVGGYLAIMNYPNKSVFVNQDGARLANEAAFEMPPMRLGATAATRAFTISGDNLLWGSDPLGGASSLAPLTYEETLASGTGFTGQIFTVGSALDIERVTAASRLPKLLGPSQEFLAQNLLISTETKKYIIAAATPRADWDQVQFITYAGTADGIAGPWAVTNVGDNTIYITSTGRIKSLSQDLQNNSSLIETFLDDPLGQYVCCRESGFHFRKWYRDLNHSRATVKFNRERLFATVYPFKAPAITKFGEETSTLSHQAFGVASLASESVIGARSSLFWEGFYDFMKPAGVALLDEDLYVISKDEYGRNKFFRENYQKTGDADTVVYTRGYFFQFPGRAKSFLRGALYFRQIAGEFEIDIDYLVNGEWVCGATCTANQRLLRFEVTKNRCKTDSLGIPLRITLKHKGCQFELESIRVDGETHRDDSVGPL